MLPCWHFRFASKLPCGGTATPESVAVSCHVTPADVCRADYDRALRGSRVRHPSPSRRPHGIGGMKLYHAHGIAGAKGRTATPSARMRPIRRSRGRLFVIVVLDGPFEDEPFVEFGKRNREAEFGHGEHVVVPEHKNAPTVLSPDMDCRAAAILFEHDIAPDRRCPLIFTRLHNPVLGGSARAQNLEDDDRIAHDLCGLLHRRAHDHAIRITPESSLCLRSP
jgi:hypothetical protein